MVKKLTIKRNASNITVDACLWKRLSESKAKRNGEIFNINQEKLSRWV